jgi:hypothetical protein
MGDESEEVDSRPSTPLLIGLGVAILALIAAATIALIGNNSSSPVAKPSGSDSSNPQTPPLKQAKWQIQSHVVPVATKAKKSLLKHQAAGVASVVKELYDALLINPGDFAQLEGHRISAKAAAALTGSKIATGKDVTHLQTTHRSAKIGLQAPSAVRASAQVDIRLMGLVGQKKVRLAHHATLWLERTGANWQVIAFAAGQNPIHRSKPKHHAGSKHQKHHSKAKH